ncbi:MAG: GNAT family N-acetyltransferase [Bifidobacterium sp.]|nr:GNAT family N-acetyltransferase [Bifidobacterium sp.]
MSVNAASPSNGAVPRALPACLVIPPIRGEMVRLRPATIDDLNRLDELDAFHNASKITGKDSSSERAAVHTWVRRSVAWSQGLAPNESGVGDPESRRTIAWSIVTNVPHADAAADAARDCVIGMIFLIDIDGWARSARIQVVLGRDYRGRGYSRDAMPRVMTYGFASQPTGLGMHRIWVAVPEKNSRSLSVYKSLGFVLSGTSRDALWDVENDKYQDLHVLDTLVDEYDPIRSLDAFGMHVIEDNPGVREALSAREHSIGIAQRRNGASADAAIAANDDIAGKTGGIDNATQTGQADPAAQTVQLQDSQPAQQAAGAVDGVDAADAFGGSADIDDFVDGDVDKGLESLADDLQRHSEGAQPADDGAQEGSWPFSAAGRKSSRQAWWRSLGRGHKNGKEGSQ